MKTEELIKLENLADNPYQPRSTDDPEHIEKLARSIAADGLLQAPKARKLDHNGSVQLAFGHSRRRAFEWLQTNFKKEDLQDRYNGYSCMPVEIIELSDEEMYRYAVTENVHRKDLAPTDLARSLKRYMEEFGANSKKTGELFGVSAATVRGMVRLLELPDRAQGLLDAGKISQGVARTLLSVKKIVPTKQLDEILGSIETGRNRWGEFETPEELIRQGLRNVDTCQFLWDAGREGKPRAGSSEKWLLDMKNFPNKFLPELTAVDAVVALGVQENEEACAAIEDYLDALNGVTVLPEFPIEKERKEAAERLDEIDPGLRERLNHLLNPPSCSACPFYAVVEGDHYCGMIACYKRKLQAWDREKVRAASKKLGIALYEPGVDDPYMVLDHTYGPHGAECRKLFEERNADLRLAPALDIDKAGYPQYGYYDVPDCARVLLTGDALVAFKEQRKKNKQQGIPDDPMKLEELREKLTIRKRDVLLWEAAQSVKAMFNSLPNSAIEIMQDLMFTPQEDILKSNMPALDADPQAVSEFQRATLAFYMLYEAAHEADLYDDTLVEYANWLGDQAEAWGVVLPPTVQEMAKQFDIEIANVSTETPKKKGKKR